MLFAILACALLQEPAPSPLIPPATVAERLAQYQADRGALGRLWSFPLSVEGRERQMRLLQDWQESLATAPFASLSRREQVDLILLDSAIRHDLAEAEAAATREDEIRDLLPFAPPLVALLEQRAHRQDVDAEATAQVLADAAEAIDSARKALKDAAETPPLTHLNRATRTLDRLHWSLRDWYRNHADYEPLYTWWCQAPWQELDRALDGYHRFLREELGGLSDADDDPLIGDPIGREALLEALAFERIAYSPEELIAIAEREFAWCQEQRRLAADAMGLDGDWRAAQEKVKAIHAEPGGQPRMIRDLAEEAIAFLEARDLITIPELAKESWRMDMMSVERQKYTPYFTGGEVISISYPTAGMEHADKLMSMRGNNLHYSRATVQHELIPGHHLQGYMAQRWNPQRRIFSTPFLVEGWALYWELRLWDLGFPQSPEDRIGMLFWRAHRCARIIFSLKFHLGEWTPEQCVDFLVEEVGHERRNATAEVRRSIQGGYGPLYQCAYMTGGLELRALHDELVDGAGWSEKTFHDAVMHAGPIPIELIRAELSGLPLSRELPVSWRFAD